tara:strand:- start:71 stop:241 length:171 start_codon:yes stop_codon:yes gene_type:complete
MGTLNEIPLAFLEQALNGSRDRLLIRLLDVLIEVVEEVLFYRKSRCCASAEALPLL